MNIKRIVVEIQPKAENLFDSPVFRMSLVRRATEEIVRAAWPSN